MRLASSSRAKTNTAVETEMIRAETAAMKEPRTIVPRCDDRRSFATSGALARLTGGGYGQVTAHSDKRRGERRVHDCDERHGYPSFLDKEKRRDAD